MNDAFVEIMFFKAAKQKSRLIFFSLLEKAFTFI